MKDLHEVIFLNSLLHHTTFSARPVPFQSYYELSIALPASLVRFTVVGWAASR